MIVASVRNGSTIVDLHLIHSFPPSRLNCDENGMPKSAYFGGCERARHSSQNRKRPVRFSLKAQGEPISIRSRAIPAIIREQLMEKADGIKIVPGEEGREKVEPAGDGRTQGAIERAIEAAFKVLNQKIVLSEEKNSMNLEHQMSLSPAEISRIVDAIDRHFDILSNLVVPEEDDKKSRRRNNKAATADVPAEVRKEIESCIDRRGSDHDAIDNILGGRMVAEDKTMNIDACSQWAHAISTHEVSNELDGFVAGDDTGRSPSDMMDSRGFNSPTMYLYNNLHKEDFLERTKGRSEAVFSKFMNAVVKSLPSGGQNGFAAFTPPTFMMAVVRTAWPWSLHNAFVPAVRGKDLIRASVDALGRHFDKLCEIYGTGEIEGAYFLTELDNIEIKNAERCKGFEEWAAKTWGAFKGKE